VTAIYEDEIRGEDVTVPIDSIVTLEIREFSTGKTVLLGVGITGTAADCDCATDSGNNFHDNVSQNQDPYHGDSALGRMVCEPGQKILVSDTWE
jgi:hypothetical protein